jgi:hypothetical protein
MLVKGALLEDYSAAMKKNVAIVSPVDESILSIFGAFSPLCLYFRPDSLVSGSL